MITIQVDYEVANNIIKKDLKEYLEDLSKDFGEAVITGRGKVFSTDANEDAKKLKKLMKAMVRVHNWYAPSGEQLKIDDYV